MGATLLHGHTKDLGGGLLVRRLLPAARRRAVGPFVFFDHFGPVRVAPTDDHDVRPHPHIGLATVTYLFEGAMMHRDSLGTSQLIEPGAINWMVAGSDIVHSERRPGHLIGRGYVNHGLQLWVALPAGQEECAPAFAHHPAHTLPQVDAPGAEVRVLIGEALGVRSPVVAASPTLYLDIRLRSGASLALPPWADGLGDELAAYAVDGGALVDGHPLPLHQMLVLSSGAPRIEAPQGDARLVLIGGASLDGPRHMWWNFVSSRRDRIEQAAQDWAQGRFATVPGDVERVEAPPLRVADGP